MKFASVFSNWRRLSRKKHPENPNRKWLKKHKKNAQTASFAEVEKDFGLWEDYMAFGPQYDTANDCPLIPGETVCVVELPFKKLRKVAIQETYQLTGQYAKESDEVKHLLNESIVRSINKELRKERKTQS